MREQHTFSQVPVADIPRSAFNRSHGHKTTFNSGFLIPIFVDEALPGDTFNVNASVFARLATPFVPIMDNLYLDVFFFGVPNRLVWDNWVKLCGEQTNPGDSIDYLVPQIVAPAGGFGVESLYDYFGMPVLVPGISVTALFSRAYNLIWNEWFRDENLQTSRVVYRTDGPDAPTDYVLLKRGKRHDYFTSCLPWPQKGPGVELPIGTTAPIVPNYGETGIPTFNVGYQTPSKTLVGTSGSANVQYGDDTFVPSPPGVSGPAQWGDPQLLADLSQATSITINSLRSAFQVQKLLERDARGGTRYTEIVRSHFGVVSPDARLQRPEYLGGGSVAVNVNPVTQTSGSAPGSGGYTNTPQGNLAAYGVAGGSGLGFTKSFVEHSMIIGLVCARADLSYQQGLPRMFTRRSRYDFYWPAFSHLGEQAVLNEEIYCQDPAVIDPATAESINKSPFGYQERFAEYRYFPSKITGKFRSQVPTSLDIWHCAQEFGALPVLGSSFIEENPPIDRVIAVTDEPQFILDSHFSMRCVRPMPTYSVPGLIDHF